MKRLICLLVFLICCVVHAQTSSFTNVRISGVQITTAATITVAANAGTINTAKGLSTVSHNANCTLSFSGAPTDANTWFAVAITNSDSAAHTWTIPSSYSVARGIAITTVSVPASSSILVQWRFVTGSTYWIFGDVPSLASNTPFGSAWSGDTQSVPSLDVIYDIFGNAVNYPLTVYGVGTAYAFTNTAAAIDFGTTDPTRVLDKKGTYLIFAQVNLAYNGATVVAETATIKVRRTNNTAADVSAVVVLDLPVSTTLTNTYGIFSIPPFIYTTEATDDSLSIFGNVSAALGAGTIDATAIGTSIVAIKLF